MGEIRLVSNSRLPHLVETDDRNKPQIMLGLLKSPSACSRRAFTNDRKVDPNRWCGGWLKLKLTKEPCSELSFGGVPQSITVGILASLCS